MGEIYWDSPEQKRQAAQWKSRVLHELHHEGLQDHIYNSALYKNTTPPDVYEEWLKSDLEAKDIIIKHLSPKMVEAAFRILGYQELIARADTWAVWGNLNELFR